MKIVSWNVNGIRAVMKKDFELSFKELDADIFCLQETKAQDDQVLEALSNFKDFHIFTNSAEKKGYSGTTIISKTKPLSVQYGMGIDMHDSEGRLITAEYDQFYLVTAYVPNAQNGLKRLEYRAQWDADLKKFIDNLNKQKPVILCGDLNVAHTEMDIKNAKSNYNKSPGYTQKEIDGLELFLNDGYFDSFRKLHPEEIKYSWWSYRFNSRAKNTGWRIDYFILSNPLIENTKSAEIHNDIFGSDHCPVSIKLDI